MSLLLDALKRAEQEKLAKQALPPAREGARASASAPAHASAPPHMPALELHPIGSGSAAAAAAHAPPASARTEAESAQALFKAKAAAPNEPERKSGVFWAVGGAILIVVAGVAAYVWYSVQSLTPKTVVRTRPSSAPVPPLQPIETLASPRPSAQAPAPPQAPPVTSVAAVTPRPVPEPRPAVPAREAREELVMNLLRDAGPAKPAPLRLTQASEAPRVPTEVAAGYEALRGGNLQAARRSYAAALANDATNLDAQLGLATVEARSGNRAAAAEHYRRTLELDPRNATALAGLASITDYAQPDRLESQLRADLARQPGSPALRFTLGNLYAAQSRWHEAQVEFFEAHRLEPGSPDILFNLAVSLDHLGQSRLASDYYRRALSGGRAQAVQFDPAPVERRLAELGFESPVPVR